jgi:hypothetical protein
MRQLSDFNDKFQKLDQKTVMNYETDGFTSYQNYLYKRALFGLKGLPENELTSICNAKKARITKVYKRGQRLINLYKQKLTIEFTNKLFLGLFPKSSLAKEISQDESLDESFINKLTFNELGITKLDIVNLFVEEGILPANFFELERHPNELPRLRKSHENKTQTV